MIESSRKIINAWQTLLFKPQKASVCLFIVIFPAYKLVTAFSAYPCTDLVYRIKWNRILFKTFYNVLNILTHVYQSPRYKIHSGFNKLFAAVLADVPYNLPVTASAPPCSRRSASGPACRTRFSPTAATWRAAALLETSLPRRCPCTLWISASRSLPCTPPTRRQASWIRCI